MMNNGTIPNVPPSEPMTGAALLDELYQFLGRFVAYPSVAAHVAHALWIAHTHLMDAWDSTPRIAFLSPEPASGKTRALEVTAPLVPLPVEAVNVTPAYLFRKVGAEDGRPTILYDEVDTVFGPKAKDNEEIRGLLNAGHRKGAVAGRCVVRGKQVFTEEIPAYAAVALAGLGGLPDTILSRSVVIRMRRRAPGELVEEWRPRKQEPVAHVIRDKLAEWARRVTPELVDVWPEMPEGIKDRDADIWEALLAVADAAGGDWPNRARVSAVSLVSDSKAGTPSLGVRLLADTRAVFGGVEHMTTDSLIKGLIALDESPWGDLFGKPLNARGLAQRLHPYGVASKQIRIGETTAKGYARADFYDAWKRYLPPEPDVGAPPYERETSETWETNPAEPPSPVSPVSHVSDKEQPSETGEFVSGNGLNPANVSDVSLFREGPLTDKSDGAPVEQAAPSAGRMAVHFSSATDQWATPQDFFDRVNAEFHFTLDACATPDNAKVATFYTPEQDGLSQPWTGVVWCNPPYGRGIDRWIGKGRRSAEENGAAIVMLLPARTDTKAWHEHIHNNPQAEIRYLPGRLKFGGAENSAPFPSALVIFRPPVGSAVATDNDNAEQIDEVRL